MTASSTLKREEQTYDMEMKGAAIESVLARTIDSDRNWRFSAPIFIDSSGDSLIAHVAGAEYRVGRESRREFGESLAPEEADRKTMGSTIQFRAVDIGRPVPFKAPPWALKYNSCADLPYRIHKRPWGGYWWIEYGGEVESTHGDASARIYEVRIQPVSK